MSVSINQLWLVIAFLFVLTKRFLLVFCLLK